MSLDALENSYVYAAPPSGFNDPFDCAVQADLKITPENYEHYCTAKKISGSEIRRRLDYYFDENGLLNEAGLIEQESLIKQLYDINRNLGVCCFSARPYNPLMWAHYADNHSGFCLGFKVGAPFQTRVFEKGKGLHFFREVEYSKTNALPEVTLDDIVSGQERVLALISEKGYRWSYEEEIRLIVSASSVEERFIYYAPELLDSVYYGLDIDEDSKRKIREIIQQKYPHAIEYDMKIDGKYYWMSMDNI